MSNGLTLQGDSDSAMHQPSRALIYNAEKVDAR
jgi:hypothetical protein